MLVSPSLHRRHQQRKLEGPLACRRLDKGGLLQHRVECSSYSHARLMAIQPWLFTADRVRVTLHWIFQRVVRLDALLALSLAFITLFRPFGGYRLA